MSIQTILTLNFNLWNHYYTVKGQIQARYLNMSIMHEQLLGKYNKSTYLKHRQAKGSLNDDANSKTSQSIRSSSQSRHRSFAIDEIKWDFMHKSVKCSI